MCSSVVGGYGRSPERMSMVQKWQVERPGHDELLHASTVTEFGVGDFDGDEGLACDPGTRGPNLTLGLGRVPH